jgi:hypothetical protein
MGHYPVRGINRGKKGERQRQNHPSRCAAKTNPIGDDPSVDVGEGANQEQSCENHVSGQCPSEAVLQENGCEKQGREKLDQGIPNAKPRMARPAAFAEDKVTENRDVIIPFDEGTAGVAIRTWKRKVLRGGKPIDANIEETAEAGSQEEEKPNVNGEKIWRNQVRNGGLPRCRFVSARFHAGLGFPYHARLALILQVPIFQWERGRILDVMLR